jgi:hypothetical protein
MRCYWFIVLSILCLWLVTPAYSSAAMSNTAIEHTVLKKTCSLKKIKKHSCKKRCLQHNKQAQPQGTASTSTDCQQVVVAVISSLPATYFIGPLAFQAELKPVLILYHSPALKNEPDPPRYA